jgi:uncharacterized protein (TIGR02594 family)
MAASSYDEALRRVLAHEGGNDDDPRDPGGRTSRGILQREWDAWRRTNPGLPADVWRAPQDQIEAIYRQKYWAALRCDDLPAGVDYAVFDYGVNSGNSRAARALQRFVGTIVDGEVGRNTIAAARATDALQLIDRICDERLAFLQGLRTWSTFGKGWGRRVAEVREVAKAMATSSMPAEKKPAGSCAETKAPISSRMSELALAMLARFAPAIAANPNSAAAARAPAASAQSAGPPWLVAGLKDIGFHETGTSRGIEKFIASAKCGNLGDPWCAIWVNAKLEDCGIDGTRSAGARSFEHDPNFLQLDGPALGAIGTMWRKSSSAGAGHVFLYLGENEKGVLGLAGNQSDGVRRAYQDRSRIVGYWWPKSVPLPKTGKVFISGCDEPVGGTEI